MSKFVGKVALITGASSGIGEAIAVAIAEEGAKIAITGRNKERLSKVAKKCEAHDECEVLELIADVTNFDGLKSLVDKTVERYGRLDILVNNAATGSFNTFVEKYTLKQFQEAFDANVRAPVFLSQYALSYLKKTKGCIINVSTALSKKSVPGGVIYCMTKSALDNFTSGFAAECAADGVRVNSINPGLVVSRFLSRSGLSEEQANDLRGQYAAGQPFGVIQSSEIAEAVLFICSTPRMTGTALVLDGGLSLDTPSG